MNQIILFGEVLFDCFPDGTQVLGGAPFNVAWHLQAFKAQPLLISRVGDDAAGRQIQSAMRSWGMRDEAVQLDPVYPTGRVEINFDNDEPRYNIVPDSAFDFIDCTQLPVFDQHSILYFGSLAFRNSVSYQCLPYLHKGRHTRFVDVNLRRPWWRAHDISELIYEVDWIKLNDQEWDELSRSGVSLDNRAVMQVLTHAESGATLATPSHEKIKVVPEHKIACVDTVGAGDAFSSVMLLGIAHNWPLPVIMQRAQAFASSVVGIRGAVSLEKSFYQHFIDAWQLG